VHAVVKLFSRVIEFYVLERIKKSICNGLFYQITFGHMTRGSGYDLEKFRKEAVEFKNSHLE
jgi:hypothetical protein